MTERSGMPKRHLRRGSSCCPAMRSSMRPTGACFYGSKERRTLQRNLVRCHFFRRPCAWTEARRIHTRSEEHTSELQSRLHLVCRLLLEKKKEELVTRRKLDGGKPQD